jgi:L-ribulose-5-phosphate 3-epimerase
MDTPPDPQGEVARAVRQSGLGVSSVASVLYWTHNPASSDPAERERALAVARRQLEWADLLGADAVLVISGVVTEREAYEEVWARSQEALRLLAADAERYGVALAVENCNAWQRFLLSPLEFRNYLDEVGHPLVGAYFDPANVFNSGYAEQWIRILGPRIRRVHFKDCLKNQGTGGRPFVHLLQGDTNWAAVMAALREVGYDGWASAEVPPYTSCPDQLLEDTARAMERIFALG